MSGIVCATRGGEGSRAVQLTAIERAKESGEPLVFLYVVDVGSVGDYDPVLEDAILVELRWLGKSLLRVAKQRAEQAGIDAEIVVREGDVKDQIEDFLRECGASLLMLGAPRGTTKTVFGDDGIERFASTIEEDTRIPVRLVRPEDVS